MSKKSVLPSSADQYQQNHQASVMSAHDQLARKIQALIPKSLDDIVRANRDQLAIRLATDEEIMELHHEVVPHHPPAMTLYDWRLIAFEWDIHGYHRLEISLLGDKPDNRFRITSTVRKIDLDRQLIITNSGTLYGLGKRGEGEPPFEHLAMICNAAHMWGWGPFFGVPGFIVD